MGRIEVEWECVDCIKRVHCTPCHEMRRTGQPDEIPVDRVMLQVSVYTTLKVTANLYQERFTNVWCFDHSNMDL
jgi:hypothetical protein